MMSKSGGSTSEAGVDPRDSVVTTCYHSLLGLDGVLAVSKDHQVVLKQIVLLEDVAAGGGVL